MSQKKLLYILYCCIITGKRYNVQYLLKAKLDTKIKSWNTFVSIDKVNQEMSAHKILSSTGRGMTPSKSLSQFLENPQLNKHPQMRHKRIENMS